MAKWKISDEEFEGQFEAALKRGKEKAKTEPRAESVFYDRTTNELILKLTNGAAFKVPCSLLREFDEADPSDIAEVELRPRGTALHWAKLDQDMTIVGLITSVLGNEVLMAELGRKGGSVSSNVKAAAARANGQKGGRPAKRKVTGDEFFVAQLVLDPASIDIPMLVQNSSHLDTQELIQFEIELNRAQQATIKEFGVLETQEGLLFNQSDQINLADFNIGDNYLKAVKEAANNAELTLAA